MTALLQSVYAAALLCYSAFIVSFALERRFSWPVSIALFLAFLGGIELLINFYPPFAVDVSTVIREFIFLLLIMIIFKGKFFQKTFVFFAVLSMTALSASLSVFLARLVFDAGPGFYLCRYCLEWGLLGLYLFLFSLFGRENAKDFFVWVDSLNWIFYTLGVFLSWFIMRNSVPPDALQGDGFDDIGRYLAGFLLSAANLFTIFITVSTAGKKNSVENDLHLAQEVIASGVNYYRRLDRILQEIRILRHDYKYQMGVIEELSRISRARYIREFLASAKASYTQTEPVVYCENPVISALLANYAERFEKNNITFQVQAVLPSDIPRFDENLTPLTNYETCIVLGNLLENAFEGTVTVPALQRRIHLYILLSEGKLLIEGKNTFDGKIISPREGHTASNLPQSRKGTGGGYGLRSITAVCNRHAGECLSEWTDREFTLRILLNL
ncbi:MAG: GHKL domain-containing protein [Treponema sp.]|jgi:hypothetical protein|nr:GHKL domain-containing protein [Treponema sp.]